MIWLRSSKEFICENDAADISFTTIISQQVWKKDDKINFEQKASEWAHLWAMPSSVGSGSWPVEVVGSTPDLWISHAEVCLCSSGNPKRTPALHTHTHTQAHTHLTHAAAGKAWFTHFRPFVGSDITRETTSRPAAARHVCGFFISTLMLWPPHSCFYFSWLVEHTHEHMKVLKGNPHVLIRFLLIGSLLLSHKASRGSF